ncbi:MAG: hypothetical protein P8P36_07365 [Akkermansiaceae bacterium]|nr:hypothetical protein [Akkermansiaceae bacterium]
MMQAYPAVTAILATVLQVFLVSCSPSVNTASPVLPSTRQHPAAMEQHDVAGIVLSAASKQKIGNKIWQNESGGTTAGLTHWNTGEEFPSIGIGHFIWYPLGFKGRWTESFPLFVAYVNQHKPESIPKWIMANKHCPWPDKTSFTRDFHGPRLQALRHWLANNVSLQTDFIIKTSRQAIPNIMRSAPSAHKERIRINYQKVSTTAHGTYALIDYVNFKGDGTNPSERYNDQGWGLMWVLLEMKDTDSGQAAASEFAAAAIRCLDRRIKNSPKARGEIRWRAGWHNRCGTYAKPF